MDEITMICVRCGNGSRLSLYFFPFFGHSLALVNPPILTENKFTMSGTRENYSPYFHSPPERFIRATNRPNVFIPRVNRRNGSTMRDKSVFPNLPISRISRDKLLGFSTHRSWDYCRINLLFQLLSIENNK